MKNSPWILLNKMQIFAFKKNLFSLYLRENKVKASVTLAADSIGLRSKSPMNAICGVERVVVTASLKLSYCALR